MDTKAFSCGLGSVGQLGFGDNANSNIFQPILALFGTEVVQVAAGAYHSAAVVKGGDLYTWGFGDCGQLGHSSMVDQHSPKYGNNNKRVPSALICFVSDKLNTIKLKLKKKSSLSTNIITIFGDKNGLFIQVIKNATNNLLHVFFY